MESGGNTLARTVKDLITIIKAPSLGTSANLLDIFSNILTIGVTIATAYGLISNVGGGTTEFKFFFALNINFAEVSLTFRLIVFLISSVALGWGLGAIISFLTASRQDHLTIISYIASLLWGILLVATADWMAAPQAETRAITFPLFTLVGAGIMLWLSVFQLRSKSASGSVTVATNRANSLLAVTIGVLFAFLLNLISSTP